ncbi:hypothetical protein LEP1GSC150_0394 [Leptospira interrogans serovar Copenhageni str. LT2050]|uniref:ABC transporter transmembrane region domain protein n=1 Tax=Leptospira interrogans serovar Copenhageni str. LT2050 TaxID=1001598 RepID=M3HE46_LEPIT|nr:hypothetical protein LEP1GSC150_0394 [Leptospira interrogans serovar Copenhageni str. LT2050]
MFVSCSSIYFFLKETYIGQRIMNGIYSEKLNHHVDYWNTIKKDFLYTLKLQLDLNILFGIIISFLIRIKLPVLSPL